MSVMRSVQIGHPAPAFSCTAVVDGRLKGGLRGVHVPLISYCNHTLSTKYGILVEEEETSQRALFIIDPKDVVMGITVKNADLGRSVDETLRILGALRFKDQFGEGCPVDWKTGQPGVATTASVDGAIEVGATYGHKKTWTEWVRPKLNRAFSGTSQQSVASFTSIPAPTSRSRSTSNLALHRATGASHSGPPSGLSSGQRSPLVSPPGNSVVNQMGMQ